MRTAPGARAFIYGGTSTAPSHPIWPRI